MRNRMLLDAADSEVGPSGPLTKTSRGKCSTTSAIRSSSIRCLDCRALWKFPANTDEPSAHFKMKIFNKINQSILLSISISINYPIPWIININVYLHSKIINLLWSFLISYLKSFSKTRHIFKLFIFPHSYGSCRPTQWGKWRLNQSLSTLKYLLTVELK